jgi:hypothetical protein
MRLAPDFENVAGVPSNGGCAGMLGIGGAPDMLGNGRDQGCSRSAGAFCFGENSLNRFSNGETRLLGSPGANGWFR